MHTTPVHILLRKIESGEATVHELTKLFSDLLSQRLTFDEQSAVYQALAQKRNAYAISEDLRFKNWLSDITVALSNAGANQKIAREIPGILTSRTDINSLAKSLHQIFCYGGELRIEDASTKRTHRVRNIALILVGGILIGWFTWHHFALPNIEPKVCSVNSVYVEGERFVHLPDASEVILDSASSLCYERPFAGNGRREVALQAGKAYFEIEPDAEHPFFITTPGGILTEVRGTGLIVDVNNEKQIVSIAVTHGAVVVHYNKDSIPVPRGKRLSIAFSTNDKKFEEFDAPTLYFRNATLEEVTKTLKERFHVSVMFEEHALKKEIIDAEFRESDMQLKHIVRTLNLALTSSNIELKLTGNMIVVRRKLVYIPQPSPRPVPHK